MYQEPKYKVGNIVKCTFFIPRRAGYKLGIYEGIGVIKSIQLGFTHHTYEVALFVEGEEKFTQTLYEENIQCLITGVMEKDKKLLYN